MAYKVRERWRVQAARPLNHNDENKVSKDADKKEKNQEGHGRCPEDGGGSRRKVAGGVENVSVQTRNRGLRSFHPDQFP